MTKTCSRCRETKPFSDFHRSAAVKDGRNNYCKLCNTAYMRARYRTMDAPVIRARNLRQNYGMTVEDYDAMLEHQDGVCAVCKQLPVGAATFQVDHCHATGVVRGILCSNCNLALGLSGDEPDRLRAMAEYLEASRCL